MENQSIKFTQSRNGYEPREVDAVTVELQRQIDDLKQQNTVQAGIIEQYNDKIQQLAENTKRLMEERTKESLRITGFMNQAAQIAEQTKQDAIFEAKAITENARKEAYDIIENSRLEAAKTKENAGAESEKIIAKAGAEAEKIRVRAQTTFDAVRTAVNLLKDNTQKIRQYNERYNEEMKKQLTEIDGCIGNTQKGIPEIFETQQTGNQQIENQREENQNSGPPDETVKEDTENSEPYDEYFEKMFP